MFLPARLLVTRYPHLCIVEDWFGKDMTDILKQVPLPQLPEGLQLTPEGLGQGMILC